MAYILPDRAPFAGPFAWCDHGIPLGHRCTWCPPPVTSAQAAPVGWSCPGCGHSYAPWVPECHHCPEPPAFIAKGNAE